MRFVTSETLLRVGRAVKILTRGARRRVIIAQQITAVYTGLHVVLTDHLTARVTGNDVGGTVSLLVDGTRGLIRPAEDVSAGPTGRAVVLTDLFAASTADFQMLRCEQPSAVSTLRCVV
jgi:hypothetical protein